MTIDTGQKFFEGFQQQILKARKEARQDPRGEPCSGNAQAPRPKPSVAPRRQSQPEPEDPKAAEQVVAVQDDEDDREEREEREAMFAMDTTDDPEAKDPQPAPEEPGQLRFSRRREISTQPEPDPLEDRETAEEHPQDDVPY